MKVSTLVAALAPFLAADAKPEDVTAGISAQLALDKAAKDKAAKDKAKDMKAAKDAEAAIVSAANNGEDEEMDDVDGEDEEEEDCKGKDMADAPEGGAKQSGKDKKAKDGNWGLGGKDAKAMDAAIAKRVDAAVAARDALHSARKDVEPILGVVAMDSAADVYKAALDKLGIATDGVHPSAFKALLQATRKGTDNFAHDSAAGGGTISMKEAFPGFDRISR